MPLYMDYETEIRRRLQDVEDTLDVEFTGQERLCRKCRRVSRGSCHYCAREAALRQVRFVMQWFEALHPRGEPGG